MRTRYTARMLRRSLAFTTYHRRQPDLPVLRLFWFNDAQAKFVTRAVESFTTRGFCPVKANTIVDRVVLAFLEGKEPGMEADASIRLGRTLFPALTDVDVEALPRAGAPVGRIRALVFQIAHEGRQRVVRVDMTRDQADAYNSALWNLQKLLKVSRDEAWFQLGGIVGRLLHGATMTDTANDVVASLAAAFPAEDLTARPDATEEDVKRWTFTTAPILTVVS